MKSRAGGHKQAFLIGIILLIAGTVSLCFWGTKKEIWFCDEIYTYESSNGFEQEWPASRTDEWMSGADVEDFFSADSDNLSLNDVTVRLYSDHVPLYFWMFRSVSFFFFKGSGSIWIGLSINLFFYLLFLGTGYGVFLYLTKNPLLSGAVMFFVGICSRLAIEQATTLRMYMCLLCAEFFLLLGGLWILWEAENGKSWLLPYGYLAAASIAGFLTHYDYWVFYGVTATVFCSWFLLKAFNKRGKKFWKTREFWCAAAWVGNFAVSLIVTVMLFPYCRWNLNRGKGKMALEAVFSFSKERLGQIGWGYERLSAVLFGGAFPAGIGLALIFGCIAGGGIVLYRRKERGKLAGTVLAVLAAQLYQIAVCYTMPAGCEERYLWGSFTLTAMCMAWGGILLCKELRAGIPGRRLRAGGRRVLAVLLAAAVFVWECAVIDGGNGVAYLFHPQRDMAVLKEYREIPWVVYGAVKDVYSYYDWTIPEQICFMTEDAQKDGEAVRGLMGKERFVLYVYEDNLSDGLDFFRQALDKDIDILPLARSTNFHVYLVEAK